MTLEYNVNIQQHVNAQGSVVLFMCTFQTQKQLWENQMESKPR